MSVVIGTGGQWGVGELWVWQAVVVVVEGTGVVLCWATGVERCFWG